ARNGRAGLGAARCRAERPAGNLQGLCGAAERGARGHGDRGPMSGREVWVTGLGAVTGAGVGTGPLLDALRAGRSAVHPQPELDGLPAASAPDPPRDRPARHLERSAALFLAAAAEAWRDAGLGDEVPDPARYGVMEGSSLGPLADVLETLRARLTTGDGAPRATGLVRFMTGAGG